MKVHAPDKAILKHVSIQWNKASNQFASTPIGQICKQILGEDRRGDLERQLRPQNLINNMSPVAPGNYEMHVHMS